MPARNQFCISAISARGRPVFGWYGAIFLTFLFFAFSSSCLASENLLVNGDFESGISPWQSWGGSLSVSEERHSQGNKAAKFEITTNGTKYIYQEYLSITQETNYKYSAYILKNDSSLAYVYLKIKYYDQNKSSLSSDLDSSKLTSKNDGFQSLQVQGKSPANASFVQLKILVNKNEGNTSVVYFDDLFFGLGEEGSSPSPSSPSSPSYPSNISLSEFMACPPTGEKEWVEIYNDNNSQVNLTSWFIRDSTDSNKQEFSCTIGAKSFYKVEIVERSFLNNSGGDTVRLFNPEKEIDSYPYSDCDSEYSWSKVGGSWCQTEPTSEAANGSCLVEESDEDENSSGNSPSSPSPTSQTSSNLSPTTSLKATSIKKTTASSSIPLPLLSTESGEVLGATQSATPSPEPEEEKKPSIFLIPVAISGIGLVLISVAAFPFLKPKIKKFFPFSSF